MLRVAVALWVGMVGSGLMMAQTPPEALAKGADGAIHVVTAEEIAAKLVAKLKVIG